VTRSRKSAKTAGTAWESAIVKALIEKGWAHAERRRLNGSHDKGDIAGIPGLVIEAKTTNRLELAAAVDEAETEKTNAGAAHGVAWIHRKGKASPLDGYVVMTGAGFLALLKEAGY
jgi:hypothetical protein